MRQMNFLSMTGSCEVKFDGEDNETTPVRRALNVGSVSVLRRDSRREHVNGEREPHLNVRSVPMRVVRLREWAGLVLCATVRVLGPERDTVGKFVGYVDGGSRR